MDGWEKNGAGIKYKFLIFIEIKFHHNIIVSCNMKYNCIIT